MTGDLTYRFGTSHGRIDLTSDVAMLASSAELRSAEWSAELGTHDLRSAVRRASTRKAMVCFSTWKALDDALTGFSLDVDQGKPGTLVAEHGWSQRAYVLASEPEVGTSGGGICVTLTVALLDGAWRRWAEPVELTVWDGSGAPQQWLDYPHPYPHGYASGRRAEGIDVAGASPCPARLTFWGPCVDPYVTIGGNAYAMAGLTLASGERCVLDGTTYAATRVGVDGTETDVTALAQRGAGVGSGRYAFERVRPGWRPVSWSGSFGITVELCEERGEPTWAR